MTADEAGVFGPISYLIVEFPGNKMTGEGMPTFDLVDRGVIRILDLMFVTRDPDGSMGSSSSRTWTTTARSISPSSRESSGLVSEDDLAEAPPVIEPGSSAAILIFENRWATPSIHVLRRGEADLVAAGYIPQCDLVRGPDAVEG